MLDIVHQGGVRRSPGPLGPLPEQNTKGRRGSGAIASRLRRRSEQKGAITRTGYGLKLNQPSRLKQPKNSPVRVRRLRPMRS